MWKKGPSYSFKKACAIIAVATLCSSGVSMLAFFGLRSFCAKKSELTSDKIEKLIQGVAVGEPIYMPFLARALGLSCDKQQSLNSFDRNEGEKKLIETCFLKEAHLKIIKPNILFIDYQPRIPLAFLANYANTVIDEEGVCFPLYPFFTPKKLPKVFLSEKNFQREGKIWGKKIPSEEMILLQEVMTLFQGKNLLQIDFKKKGEESLGKREIVIIIENEGHSHTLRLQAGHLRENIKNYFLLSNDYLKKEKKNCIIDFRLPHMAFTQWS